MTSMRWPVAFESPRVPVPEMNWAFAEHLEFYPEKPVTCGSGVGFSLVSASSTLPHPSVLNALAHRCPFPHQKDMRWPLDGVVCVQRLPLAWQVCGQRTELRSSLCVDVAFFVTCAIWRNSRRHLYLRAVSVASPGFPEPAIMLTARGLRNEDAEFSGTLVCNLRSLSKPCERNVISHCGHSNARDSSGERSFGERSGERGS